MALKEQDIVLTTQDASGNTVIKLPITRIENVEGGVKSVNGTAADTSGNVTLTKTDITDSLGYTPLQTAPVTSVNGKTGAVTLTIPATPKAYITTTYKSGNNWYRVWSDGWIEQGGLTSSLNTKTWMSFNKAFGNTNYTFVATGDNDSYHYIYICSYGKTTTGCNLAITRGGETGSGRVFWYACGY